jgi:imidazolonepropionase-like amidohydrolase
VADGFDFVKLYMELSMVEFSEAQAVADELGVYTVGHIPYQVGFENAAAAGLDEIAHLEELTFDLMWSEGRPSHTLTMDQWLESIVRDALQTYGEISSAFDPDEFERVAGDRLDRMLLDLQSEGIPVGTTLATYEVVNQKLYDQEAFLDRAVNVYLPPELVQAVINGQDRHQLVLQALGENSAAWHWKTGLDLYLLQRLHEAGVVLVSGTDAGSSSIGVVEGFATHDDLRLLTQGGYTPYEALQTATVNADRVVASMTGKSDFGTIQSGKRADLVLVAGDPLQDIRNTAKILGVMVRGRWYPAAELEQMIALDN